MAANPERLQFQEAIDFYRGKIRLPTSSWTDIWQQQHSHAFVVAGAAQDDLIEDMYNAIRTAQADGTGYPAFRQQFEEIAAKHGWAYKGTPGWRSKVVYQTNIQQAYNAGRWKQMDALKHLRPYIQYDHTSIEHPRLEHQAWDGLVLPFDDPWWDYHMPQNGWGCKCRVYSLTRSEAAQWWGQRGKTGPDESPEIEWEVRNVGTQGSTPRTVRVPKGIDPGFAYNPGKAWLEPHTTPPLTGYDQVLKQRNTPWPTGFTPPPVPKPTPLPATTILPAGTAPEVAVADFLDVFGATMDEGAAFTDSAGTTMAITKGLFVKGGNKEGDNFKWLAAPDKADRLKYINLMALTIIEPDEIWWSWEKDAHHPGRWRLKRRYLRAFQIDGDDQFGISVFEWSSAGWQASTAFMASKKTAEKRAEYFNKQRIGRLMFRK